MQQGQSRITTMLLLLHHWNSQPSSLKTYPCLQLRQDTTITGKTNCSFTLNSAQRWLINYHHHVDTLGMWLMLQHLIWILCILDFLQMPQSQTISWPRTTALPYSTRLGCKPWAQTRARCTKYLEMLNWVSKNCKGCLLECKRGMCSIGHTPFLTCLLWTMILPTSQ